MSKHKDDLWNPADYDDEPRSNGNFGRDPQMQEAESVWDAIADTPEEAANLRARSELMHKIGVMVKERNWTEAEAARRCGITQQNMNELLMGRVSRFSLDALGNIAAAIGVGV